MFRYNHVELNREHIRDTYQGIFYLKYKIAISYCIFKQKGLKININYFVFEHLCKASLNFAILFLKNAIFGKWILAHFDAKLWPITPYHPHVFKKI
jgi:hypothetical protein